MERKHKSRPTLEQILQRAAYAMLMQADSVSVNTRDSDGDTPLHMAATWGDAYAVSLLVDAGADVNAKGDMGATPLYFAISFGHVKAAEKLIALGADGDIVSEFGLSPKQKAKEMNRKDLVELFKRRP